MKTAALAAFLLAVLIAGNHGQQDQAQAADVQNTGGYSPRPAAIALADGTAAQQAESRYEKTKGYLKRAVGPEYLAAWALVFAAGVGLYATFRTLSILEDQTEAVKKSADAAKLTAQAVINSERAWLIPVIESIRPNILPNQIPGIPGSPYTQKV